MNESDSMYFNGYTYDTVPDVPYGTGGIPQYNPMIVDDRIELMDEVIKELEDYWKVSKDMYEHGIFSDDTIESIKNDNVWNKENDKHKNKDRDEFEL